MACFDKFKKTEEYHVEQSNAIRSSERYRAAIKNPTRMEKMLIHLTKFKISEQKLQKLYVEEKLPVMEIAKLYGVTLATVYRKLKRFGISPSHVRGGYTQYEHRERIERVCQLLKEKYRIIPLIRYIPDVILIDFAKEKVFGVEVVGANRNIEKPRKKRQKILEEKLLDDVFIIKNPEEVDKIVEILRRQR